MKAFTIHFLVFMFMTSAVFAQTNDQLVLKKGGYFLHENKLTKAELKNILKSDSASANEFKKYRTLNGIGIAIGTVVQVGVFVVTQFTPGGILAGTLGAILIELPFTIPAGTHYSKAIKKYNLAHGGATQGGSFSSSGKKSASTSFQPAQDSITGISTAESVKKLSDPTPPRAYAKQANQPGQSATSEAKSGSVPQKSETAESSSNQQKEDGFFKKLKYSGKAGMNMSMKSSDPVSDYDRFRPGFKVGIAAEYSINNRFSVESGLFFTTKGENFKFPSYTLGHNLNYLELPVNGIYKINVEGKDIFLHAGPYVAYIVGARGIVKSGDNITKTKLDPKKIDYGLNVGISADIKQFRVGLQYSHGLANVFESESKNRVLSLTVGYGIDLNSIVKRK
jgi:hypothetical protein